MVCCFHHRSQNCRPKLGLYVRHFDRSYDGISLVTGGDILSRLRHLTYHHPPVHWTICTLASARRHGPSLFHYCIHTTRRSGRYVDVRPMPGRPSFLTRQLSFLTSNLSRHPSGHNRQRGCTVRLPRHVRDVLRHRRNYPTGSSHPKVPHHPTHLSAGVLRPVGLAPSNSRRVIRQFRSSMRHLATRQGSRHRHIPPRPPGLGMNPSTFDGSHRR
mmetsp:Transcript_56553/g.137301  ORF Transcript_56553/g.137301 Transcript_56553/m.137301 type:complete len:215 (+) Transcript_56553:1257-1901(+)